MLDLLRVIYALIGVVFSLFWGFVFICVAGIGLWDFGVYCMENKSIFIFFGLCAFMIFLTIYLSQLENRAKNKNKSAMKVIAEDIINLLKRFFCIGVGLLGSTAVGIILMYAGVGLLSVPIWATILLVLFLGKFLSGVIDVIGGVTATGMIYLSGHKIFWGCLSSLAVFMPLLWIGARFWAFDVPYDWIAWLVWLGMSALYFERSFRTIIGAMRFIIKMNKIDRS